MRDIKLEYEIIKECRKDLSRFDGMNEHEVYDWICNRFGCDNYLEIKVASLKVFVMAHDSYNFDWEMMQKYYLENIKIMDKI